MLAATAAVAAHAVAPFWPFFFIGPVMFLIIVALLITLIVRRRRYWGGPWQAAPGGGAPWMRGAQSRSAEQILADRFARGDVDETEYRARLEVLRANRPEA